MSDFDYGIRFPCVEGVEVQYYEWTENHPTEDGFYWAAYDRDDDPEVIEVIGEIALFTQDETEYPLDDFSFWLGPLPKPDRPWVGDDE